MWTNDTPTRRGFYLCAWAKGEEWVYGIGKWTGEKWECTMSADPEYHQSIASPTEFWQMIDEISKR